MEPIAYPMEDPYMVKPYGPQPIVAYPTLGHPRAYPGPYIVAADQPRAAIGYSTGGQDFWQMREASS